tara:strand:- start:2366 stop:2995 length:630 start_codon:yes stop_codon:yes gene_type:complete
MIKLWMISKKLPALPISDQEINWGNYLSGEKKKEYFHSRGYIRKTLSSILNFKPLDLPLYAPPGKPPILNIEDGGYLGISHSKDYLLFGYSAFNFGIDLERSDREISSHRIIQRFYSDKEIKILDALNDKDKRDMTLQLWVAKEASIKFQKGRLFDDLKSWECNHNLNKTVNNKKNISLNLNVFKFIDWYFSVVSNKKLKTEDIIICYQ